jgi:predicted nucleic acid-binding protein
MPGSSKGHASRGTPPRYVLDSFALLTWLQDEPGADVVQDLLEKAKKAVAEIFVSWMNLSEVYYIVMRRSAEAAPQLAADRVVETIENLPLHIETAGKREAIAAARIKAIHSMSLADAFAAALAMAKGARIVTGDPEFESIEQKNDLTVVWLPRKSAR